MPERMALFLIIVVKSTNQVSRVEIGKYQLFDSPTQKKKNYATAKKNLFRKLKPQGSAFYKCNTEIQKQKVVLSILSAIPAKINFEGTYCFKVFNPKHFVKEQKVNIPHIGLFYFAS